MVSDLVLSRKRIVCFILVIFVSDRVYSSLLHITEEFLWITFVNFSMLTVGQPVQPKMQFLLIRSRSMTKGNCMWLLFIGDNSLVEVLRCLTSMELFLNPGNYRKHCWFNLAFDSQKDKIRPYLFFFFASV